MLTATKIEAQTIYSTQQLVARPLNQSSQPANLPTGRDRVVEGLARLEAVEAWTEAEGERDGG